ncbi:AMP phosphorylase [Candidatus Woesearchaeota archaeon]|nr:AMP phosphorylase [Candidatus Woesearchaeota archaeon]
MKLIVKDVDIAAGGVYVVLLNQKDAELLDLHHMDRVVVQHNSKKIVAVLNIGESNKPVSPGRIGLFEEVISALKVKNGDTVSVSLARKPNSIVAIRKKLDGRELSYEDTLLIVKDIVNDRLTSIELTSYVAANYTLGMSRKEIVDLTKAMTVTGEQIKIKSKPVLDIHSIGGVPGNRTTIIIVPIILAAGCVIPKTSSRAITSPAGTADTMEVFCPVIASAKKIKSLLKEIGGFILWGGAVNLAPADDKIIKVEHPLSIDAEGQMLASIMAKKACVSATHLLMEIPLGAGSKVKNREEALHLKNEFEFLGKELGINILAYLSDGTQPIGNGIGPILEARDCLWLLQNDPRAPQDLREKSLEMAGLLLEFSGKVKKGQGYSLAEQLLNSGKAYNTFVKLIKAQGGKDPSKNVLNPSNLTFTLRAANNGYITHIDTIAIAKIARLAGAPKDINSGIYLYKHKDNYVKKGDALLTVYAHGKEKLVFATEACKELKPHQIE